jgi:four helix bundle protein
MSGHNYINLQVWKKSGALVKQVYALTAGFPKQGSLGLTSRFRRAVILMSLNIAEGFISMTDKVFSHFSGNSFGTALEIENIISLYLQLAFISQAQCDEFLMKISEIQKMLRGFKAQLNCKYGFLKPIFLSISASFMVLDY